MSHYLFKPACATEDHLTIYNPFYFENFFFCCWNLGMESILRLKRVRDKEYVAVPTILVQLNLFFIMCKYIMFIPAQSKQRSAEAKLC